MVEFMDLVYDKTGLGLFVWLSLFGVLTLASVLYYAYKYKKVYHGNQELYKKSKNYLEKAEEFRRKPLPLGIFIVLVFMVIIEAIGFSYIFSQYILNDASNSDLRIAGVLGAILLAMILVPLTHVSGEAIYYNKKIDTLDSYFIGRDDIKMSEIGYLGIDNTNEDDNKKDRAYSIFSRIEPEIKKGKFVRKKIILGITIIIIAAIAIGSYKVRESSYLTQEKMISDKFDNRNSKFNKEVGGLPDFMVDAIKQNAVTQNRAILESKRNSNLTTYIVLMFMFIAIQVIGIFSGMNWGFVGKESKQAYLNIRNYKEGKGDD